MATQWRDVMETSYGGLRVRLQLPVDGFRPWYWSICFNGHYPGSTFHEPNYSALYRDPKM